MSPDMQLTDTITTDWLWEQEACELDIVAFTEHFGEDGTPTIQSVYDWLQTAAPDGGERTDWALWLADRTGTGVDWPHFTYRNGKLHGRYRMWWANGQPWVVCTYRNGKLHGRYRDWFDNGQLERDYTYCNGELHGRYRKWLSNGQPWKACTHENDELITDHLQDEA